MTEHRRSRRALDRERNPESTRGGARLPDGRRSENRWTLLMRRLAQRLISNRAHRSEKSLFTPHNRTVTSNRADLYAAPLLRTPLGKLHRPQNLKQIVVIVGPDAQVRRNRNR